MERKVEIERFREFISLIEQRFPQLSLDVVLDHPNVEGTIDIPQQSGLKFDIHFNLQNCDELHICAGDLWVEWFPCGKQDVYDRFVEAAVGLISGSHRIVEYRVFGMIVKSQLQEPIQHCWKTIATSFWGFGAIIPWPRKKRILQNV